MKSEETWKPIKGLPPYEFSNLGRVRGNRGLVKPAPNKSWLLVKDKKRVAVSYSKLMRELFPYEWIKELEEEEEAKPIKGYEGYFITNKARVFSIKSWSWIKFSLNKSYYYLGGPFGSYLHTLVGRHFLSDWKEGLFILHKEETLSYPEINFPENLWVGTHQDNRQDCWNKDRQGRQPTRDKATGRFQPFQPL